MLVNWHDPDHVYLVCGKTDLIIGTCQGRFKMYDLGGLEID